MFYIDQNTSGFVTARDEHYLNVRYVIKKKIFGNKFSESHPKGLNNKIQQVKGIDSKVKIFFADDKNMREILIGTPDVLDRFKDYFKRKKEKDSLMVLFNYEAFISKNSTFKFYNGYNLAKNISFGTCIYCNRLYTHTIINKKGECVARPTFDHWFPKSIYPLLALSFYNLIPSCNICNSSVKKNKIMLLSKNFHPYYKHSKKLDQLDFRFSFTLLDHLNAECKIISNNKFTSDSINDMKLNELYSLHHDDIRDLIYIKKAYSSSYISSLENLLNMPLNRNEVFRLAFGVHYEDSLLFHRPLSKLKKDILKELGII